MKVTLRKILKIHWLIKQSLTKKPTDRQAKVSDLFIWRGGKDWNTYFELFDLPSVFGDEEDHFVDLVFFDQLGKEIYTQNVALLKLEKQILKISSIIDKVKPTGNIGTFAVFHSKIPNSISQLNSWITERGYIGFQYKNAPLKSYVHGNYDAIAKTNNAFQLLGGVSFLYRKYQLQYLFLPKNNYEVVIVNPCSNVINIKVQVISMKNGAILNTQVTKVNPRMPFIFLIEDIIDPCKIVIKSRLVMARPIVFSYNNNKGDVFHG